MVPQPTSSISNSKQRLGWIFVPALLLLSAYAVLIRTGCIPPTDGFQVRDKNRIKSERYALDPELRPTTILLGSSLTANLPTQEISSGVFNLGLAGESVWTGLELLRGRPEFRPRIVVLEVSELLLRPTDREFVDGVLAPRTAFLRRVFPMFRTEYQPAGVLLKQIGRWQKRRKAAAGAVASSGVLPVTDRLIEQARQTGEIGLKADERSRLQEACARLRAQIDELQRKGTRCVLLDVPGEPALAATLRNRQLTALFEQEFPASGFAWIRPATGFQCKTWDAIHLVQDDALSYARYVCHELEAQAGLTRATQP